MIETCFFSCSTPLSWSISGRSLSHFWEYKWRARTHWHTCAAATLEWDTASGVKAGLLQYSARWLIAASDKRDLSKYTSSEKKLSLISNSLASSQLHQKEFENYNHHYYYLPNKYWRY